MPMTPDAASPPLVLIVEDDVALAGAIGRTLERQGFNARIAEAAATVLESVDDIDVIVTDLNMPGMNGLELLQELRERGREVPVIVLTGEPSLASAMRAVQLGAYRYFTKPVETAPLVEAIRSAAVLHRLARVSREARELAEHSDARAELAKLESAFVATMDTLYMVFQPIASGETRGILAYEALMRSREPRLPGPAQILAASERLQRVHVLGRTTRALTAARLEGLPDGTLCFVNVHAYDFLDPELFHPEAPLTRYASRVVLELTERASGESIADLRERVTRLREMGFRLAIDDVGAGYAGLQYFAQLAPDFAKIDMSIIRGLDTDPVRQRIVLSLAQMCRDLGIKVVAEGVETVGERDALVRIGCDALQGYLLGRPAEAFAPVQW